MINIRKLEAKQLIADAQRKDKKRIEAEQEDDGVDFHERMNEIHAELAQLNQEAGVLMDEIQKAWEELKSNSSVLTDEITKINSSVNSAVTTAEFTDDSEKKL